MLRPIQCIRASYNMVCQWFHVSKRSVVLDACLTCESNVLGNGAVRHGAAWCSCISAAIFEDQGVPLAIWTAPCFVMAPPGLQPDEFEATGGCSSGEPLATEPAAWLRKSTARLDGHRGRGNQPPPPPGRHPDDEEDRGEWRPRPPNYPPPPTMAPTSSDSLWKLRYEQHRPASFNPNRTANICGRPVMVDVWIYLHHQTKLIDRILVVDVPLAATTL